MVKQWHTLREALQYLSEQAKRKITLLELLEEQIIPGKLPLYLVPIDMVFAEPEEPEFFRDWDNPQPPPPELDPGNYRLLADQSERALEHCLGSVLRDGSLSYNGDHGCVLRLERRGVAYEAWRGCDPANLATHFHWRFSTQDLDALLGTQLQESKVSEKSQELILWALTLHLSSNNNRYQSEDGGIKYTVLAEDLHEGFSDLPGLSKTNITKALKNALKRYEDSIR